VSGSGDASNVLRAASGGLGAPDVLPMPSFNFWQELAPAPRGTRHLAFELAGASFALPLAHVREVDRLPPVTPLPNVPGWLLGATNLHGEIVSVVDLSAFLGLGAAKLARESRLLVCRAGAMEVGLLVERVRDIRELPDAAIRPPAGQLPGRSGRYLAGIHAAEGRLTLVLDVPGLLQSGELRRFE
jgi:purine-binding chemotaxis protein CheW